MNLRRHTVVGISALVMLAPAALWADGPIFRDFSSYCTTGSLTACASVTVEIVYAGDGTSFLTMRVQNLQGTSEFDNTGGWRLTNLRISVLSRGQPPHPALDWGPGREDYIEGAVGEYGDPRTWYRPDGPFPGDYPFDTPAGFFPLLTPEGITRNGWFSFDTYGHAIIGCSPIPLQPPPVAGPGGGWSPSFTGAFQTCPSQGLGGSFVFRLQASWEVDPADINIAWWGPGPDLLCDTRDATSCSMMVTPEPITILLLGSGLTGLGGARFLRRRKRERG